MLICSPLLALRLCSSTIFSCQPLFLLNAESPAASHKNRNQVRHTDHAIAVHFAILGHALGHLSVRLQVVHVTPFCSPYILADVVDGRHWDVEINVCEEVGVVWCARILMELILILPTVQLHLILLDVLTPAFLNLMRGIRRMLCDHPLQYCSCCSQHRH